MSKIVGVNLSDGSGKGKELVSKLQWSEREEEERKRVIRHLTLLLDVHLSSLRLIYMHLL